MIITISGDAGAGKSTIAKMLSDRLGLPRYYIGGIRREKAKEKGMTLDEYNKLGENDPTTDFEVDNYQKELGELEDNFIIEGRTSWYFIPHSLKIYFKVNEREGAERISKELQAKNDRNEGNNLKTVEDVMLSIQKRRKSDDFRYKKYFNIDIYNMENYDYIIDTSNLTKDEVFEKIWKIVKKYAV